MTAKIPLEQSLRSLQQFYKYLILGIKYLLLL